LEFTTFGSKKRFAAMLTPILIFLSICGSTMMILLNKKIMSTYGFGFPTFLTSYHFFLTWAVLTFMASCRLFEYAAAVS
jgi:hypothetical protein